MQYQSINDLMDLFHGYDHAYGAYKLTGEVADGKVLGKAYSLKGDVTVELWHKHLTGSQGLGIIPINENSKVKFAAIDVDDYKMNITAVAKKVKGAGLPLIPCRTKSGGLHLYLFLKEFSDAGVVQARMREFAAMLEWGACEIFPKQTKILVERGDIGQWINMPYFDQTKTDRYAIDDEGETLALENFICLARSRQVTLQQLELINLGNVQFLPGGPPCLNALSREGFPAGTRNNGLLNMGVYCKRSNPDGWKEQLEEYNLRFMSPPLNPTEVLGVIKSLSKKDFTYMCKQQPIVSRCNQPLCRQCEYGIGKPTVGMPKFGTLTKLCTTPPIWFLEVEGGGRLELTTDDLQNPMHFQNVCMSILNIMPPILKRNEWSELVSELLKDVSEIHVPEEATPRGQLMQHLEEFCTSRVQGKTHDELLLGKPWTNNKRHYFRLRDFLSYLERQKFRLFNLNYIAMFLKDIGGDKHFFNIRGKGCNCFSIPEFNNKQTESFATPEIRKEEPYA